MGPSVERSRAGCPRGVSGSVVLGLWVGALCWGVASVVCAVAVTGCLFVLSVSSVSVVNLIDVYNKRLLNQRTRSVFITPCPRALVMTPGCSSTRC